MDPKDAAQSQKAFVSAVIAATSNPDAVKILERHGLVKPNGFGSHEIADFFGRDSYDWKGADPDFFKSPTITPAAIEDMRAAGFGKFADAATTYAGHLDAYKAKPNMANALLSHNRETGIKSATDWLTSLDGKYTIGNNSVVKDAAKELTASLKALGPPDTYAPGAYQSAISGVNDKLGALLEKLPPEAAETVRTKLAGLGDGYPDLKATLNAKPEIRFNPALTGRGADAINMNYMPVADAPSLYRQVGYAIDTANVSNHESMKELARAATEVMGELPEGMVVQASHLKELREKIIERAADSSLAKGFISDRQYFTEVAGGVIDSAIDRQYTDVMASLAKTDPKLAATLTEHIAAMPPATGADRFRQLATLTTAAEGRNAVETIRTAVGAAVEAIQPDTAKLSASYLRSVANAGAEAIDDATIAVSGKAAKLLKLGSVLPVLGGVATVALTTMQANAAHAYEKQGMLPKGAADEYKNMLVEATALEFLEPTGIASEVAKNEGMAAFLTKYNVTSPEVRAALDPTLFGISNRTDDIKNAIIKWAEANPDNPALKEIADVQRGIATAPVTELAGLQTRYETLLDRAVQDPAIYKAMGIDMRKTILSALPGEPSDIYSPQINGLITAKAELANAKAERLNAVPMREFIPGINYFTGTEARDANAARIAAAEKGLDSSYKTALESGDVVSYAIRDLPPSTIITKPPEAELKSEQNAAVDPAGLPPQVLAAVAEAAKGARNAGNGTLKKDDEEARGSAELVANNKPEQVAGLGGPS